MGKFLTPTAVKSAVGAPSASRVAYKVACGVLLLTTLAVTMKLHMDDEQDQSYTVSLAQKQVREELLLDAVATKKLKEAVAAAGKAPSEGEREKISEILMPIANHLAVRCVCMYAIWT